MPPSRKRTRSRAQAAKSIILFAMDGKDYTTCRPGPPVRGVV